jgi:GT2 family glycosyltransferase
MNMKLQTDTATLPVVDGMREQDTVKLSIVIPSYKSTGQIANCLESLREQVQHRQCEVIVVDSSPEDISPFIKDRFPFVRTIHLPKQTYPGTARTIGIHASRAPIIAFTDTDCRVDPQWVKKILAAHENGKQVVGGPVCNGTPWHPVGTAEYLLEFSELVPGHPSRAVRFIPTCNISFKRSVFDKIGKLEDSIKGSDALFARQINLLGEKVFFEREICIWHTNRKSLKKYLVNQFHCGKGGAEVRLKEKQRGAVLVRWPILIPLIPFARTLLIAGRFLRYDFGGFVRFWLLYPLIFMGMVAYTYGFWRGYRGSK